MDYDFKELEEIALAPLNLVRQIERFIYLMKPSDSNWPDTAEEIESGDDGQFLSQLHPTIKSGDDGQFLSQLHPTMDEWTSKVPSLDVRTPGVSSLSSLGDVQWQELIRDTNAKNNKTRRQELVLEFSTKIKKSKECLSPFTILLSRHYGTEVVKYNGHTANNFIELTQKSTSDFDFELLWFRIMNLKNSPEWPLSRVFYLDLAANIDVDFLKAKLIAELRLFESGIIDLPSLELGKPKSENGEPEPELITLKQAAGLVKREPNTLYKHKKKWPKPHEKGAGNRPDQWLLSELKPILIAQFPNAKERIESYIPPS